MTLDHLWAGWRSAYVTTAVERDTEGCVLCGVLADGTHVVWRGDRCAAVLNAFPYTNGHLMVLPVRHAGELEDLTPEEAAELWTAVRDAVVALKAAYQPDGLNLGVNLGRVAGAGVTGHVHVHALPRWNGDTNFMTTVADTRVLPEALSASLDKLRSAWPTG